MTTCTQSLANGEACNAPAINNTTSCRHHNPNRPRPTTQLRSRESQPLKLPPLVDKNGVLSAIVLVIHAVSERRIKRCEGGTLLFGLQMASSLMTELDQTASPYLDEEYGSSTAPISPSLEPAQLSASIARFGEMREKLEAKGHVFYTPTPEDEKELMALFNKGQMQQVTDLYLTRQEAWKRSPAGKMAQRENAKLAQLR